jgi:acetyltransferase-like isoleucine patch superfamily enzyme
MKTGIDSTAQIINPEYIKIGKGVYIGPNVMLHGYYKNKFEIGNNVFISAGCNIYGAGGLIIEDNVGIGPNVTILGSSHKMDKSPINQQPLVFKPIRIGEGSDIGAGTTIIGGKIGKGVQIGAMSLVNKDLEDNIIAVGIPCKKVRKREM